MRMMKHFLTAVILGAGFSVSAQNYLGIPQSNYSGVMGTDVNPASFVDGRFVVDINLASFSFDLWTDAISYDTKDMPKWWTKSFKSDANPAGTNFDGDNPFNDWMLNPADSSSVLWDNYFAKKYQENVNTTDKTYGIYNNVEIDVLNFMFHINRKIAVGAAIKSRTILNLDDVDPKLAVLAENELDYTSLWNQTFNEKLLDLNFMSWMEYGLVYSQVIKDDGEHFMKAGGKAKWLNGLASFYIHTDNFDYNLLNDDTSQVLAGDFSYGHSSGMLDELGGDGEITMGAFGLPKSASKFGIGLDLGFVYEWRPDWKEYKYDMDGETNLWRRDKDKYKIRAGASVLDIGGMKFQKGGLSQDFRVDENNLFDLHVFDGSNSLVKIDSTIDSLIQNDADWTSTADEKTYFMALPTALSLQFDYNIYKWFYVNATGMVSLQNRKNPNRVRTPNQISVTPSFDHAWFGLHLPLSYNKYSGFKAGVATRLGPLTVGVNDFRVLFASGSKLRGAGVFAGLRLPVLYSHPSDVDGDFVSDEKDECLVVPGIWDFKGCPDTDRDGIKDLDDHCPNEAGLAEYNGCPDKDGDKIPDKDDACPELPGDIAFKGCPDRDNDSIIDPKDDCPDTPGLAKFNGCPDTDNDGIMDSEDACPDVPGPLVNNGCPDTDNDGLFDFIDNCPTEFGPKENNGCPWPDTDGDGILDKDDQCPNLKGPIANKGCPYQDTDNDGVLDKDDKCPATPGPVANEGCPEIEQEVEEILKTAFENLEFETAKDIIKEVSIPSLSELAEVLVKKPDWKLQIAGHTDNVGDAQANLILSKKRAEAVKKFMISKGIAAERLSVLYFGETMPVADNNTPEGRQKNRRVEMTIIFN